jgi:hypothetical protein
MPETTPFSILYYTTILALQGDIRGPPKCTTQTNTCKFTVQRDPVSVYVITSLITSAERPLQVHRTTDKRDFDPSFREKEIFSKWRARCHFHPAALAPFELILSTSHERRASDFILDAYAMQDFLNFCPLLSILPAVCSAPSVSGTAAEMYREGSGGYVLPFRTLLICHGCERRPVDTRSQAGSSCHCAQRPHDRRWSCGQLPDPTWPTGRACTAHASQQSNQHRLIFYCNKYRRTQECV